MAPRRGSAMVLSPATARRVVAWLVTGPVGHVVAGVIDWLSVFRQWAWARARGRKPFQ